jgi:CHASE3 domain sensor protein|tara:strand:+ start:969 stop:1187 length:219 start_codon:yes stop_codon:yes gene_type:complete
MTKRIRTKHIILVSIKRAKEILKTQERLNYFPEYTKMIKREIKEMQEEIKKIEEFQAAKKLQAQRMVPGNCH